MLDRESEVKERAGGEKRSGSVAGLWQSTRSWFSSEGDQWRDLWSSQKQSKCYREVDMTRRKSGKGQEVLTARICRFERSAELVPVAAPAAASNFCK